MKSQRNSTRRERGNTIVETAFALFPLILMLLGSSELLRAMWMYHSVSAAVKSGVRYSVVHGQNCVTASPACAVTVGDIASRIQRAGLGLDPSSLQLHFTADTNTYTCSTLQQCTSNATMWPPDGYNSPGMSVTIQGVYSFKSVLSLLWRNGNVNMIGEATEVVQF